jgi:hypothetical protein
MQQNEEDPIKKMLREMGVVVDLLKCKMCSTTKMLTLCHISPPDGGITEAYLCVDCAKKIKN